METVKYDSKELMYRAFNHLVDASYSFALYIYTNRKHKDKGMDNILNHLNDLVDDMLVYIEQEEKEG